ncbi:hypothetical protein [Aestuariimicrobium ganziense]|uniref:hypothetical protein n=1 Tax=Aestuariimicrobium ganziense TaxID=2773677 RepID=UPI0019436F6A|nr:hypothetical protein [Aestuariimicrobium ganziense]
MAIAQPNQAAEDAPQLDLAVRRRAVLDQMRERQRVLDRAYADRFMLAAEFADLYPVVDDETPWALHGERLVSLGGEGCPDVAEFAGLEMGARLGTRHEWATATMHSALSVRHRLPEFWLMLDQLRVEVPFVQELASITRELAFADCLALSARLATMSTHTAPTKLLEYAKAAVMQLLSASTLDASEQALADRHVRVDQGEFVAHVSGSLAKADGHFLDAQLDQLARVLGQGGDTDAWQVRRAKALGVLASPARALQLLQASLLDQQLPDGTDLACPAAGQRGHVCGQVTVDPEKLLPRAVVYVHLSEQTLMGRSPCAAGIDADGPRDGRPADGTLGASEGVARVEKLGPMLRSMLTELLGHTRVRLTPVLRVGGQAATSAYEVPQRMQEAVRLRSPVSVFPFSTRSSRGLDLDHTVPFDPGGAPGQTNEANLGPLARKEHRAKTHAGWRVRQQTPGYFLWTSPLGYRYLVTPDGTVPLDPSPP